MGAVYIEQVMSSRVLRLPSGAATIDGEPRAYLRDDHGLASLLTAMAGAAAERELTGVAGGTDGDRPKVLQLIAALGVDSDTCWLITRQLVQLHRERIFAVAQALLSASARPSRSATWARRFRLPAVRGRTPFPPPASPSAPISATPSSQRPAGRVGAVVRRQISGLEMGPGGGIRRGSFDGGRQRLIVLPA
jgi:hypothetical protein